MSSDLKLLEDDKAPAGGAAVWRVLVVDDDPEVHAVTRLALNDFEFIGRRLEIISAQSASEARGLLVRNPDVALVLLDVVMETEHAGLDFARYIRDEIGNKTVRIVLRTGQPGQAPPREVVNRYEIDDYRTKTELTYERLYTLVLTSLRTYGLLQRMQEHQAALQRSNQELESFAYVASHDLQTPLRGVIGFAQLLQSRYKDKVDQEGQEMLAFIVSCGHDMRAVISDLLEFSRVGRVNNSIAPVDLNLVLQAVTHQLQATISQRGADVRCNALPTIDGNAVQMEQLFRNLLDNAIKFQPGDVPRVEVSARVREGGFWEVRVRDWGIGIDPAQADRIFELFRRLHPSDQFPGTGIGLAICKKIVEFHGGTIRVEPAPEHGSVFVIVLPSMRAPEAVLAGGIMAGPAAGPGVPR
jgi:signal transduction histidine kinase